MLETFHQPVQPVFAISHGPTAAVPISIALRVRVRGFKNSSRTIDSNTKAIWE
jgi:hypothetical protein